MAREQILRRLHGRRRAVIMTVNVHSSTDTPFDSTGSLVPIPCPECGGTPARRSHRNGLAEKTLGALYIYPFRCRLCGHRFFVWQWGIRYHRTGRSIPGPPLSGPAIQPGHFSSLH
jgi:predicted RNA-binding Zn-ribbon protein involved in translation (DUF1610 family)